LEGSDRRASGREASAGKAYGRHGGKPKKPRAGRILIGRYKLAVKKPKKSPPLATAYVSR